MAAIIVRNLQNSHESDLEAQRLGQRPLAPKRSLSTASNASGHTLRRSASNRTLRPSARRRASSIGSEYVKEQRGYGRIDDQTSLERQAPQFLAWDLQALKPALRGKMVRAYVSLAEEGDDRPFFQTGLSSQGAMNHAWGIGPDSESDHDGIDLHGLPDEIGLKEKVRIVLWIKHGTEDGKESKVLDEEITLSKLAAVPKNDLQRLDAHLPANTIIVGLRHSISTMPPPDLDDLEGDAAQKPRFRDLKGKNDSVQYYYASKNSEESSTRSLYPRSTMRKWLKQGLLARAYEIEDVLRILQMQSQHVGLLEEVRGMQDRILSTFDDEKESFSRVMAYRERKEALRVLVAQRETAREQTREHKRLKERRQEDLSREKARLEVAKRVLLHKKVHYEELHKKMVQLAKLRDKIESRIFSRRVSLLRHVERIYPIELLDGVQLLFNIVEIPLATPRDANGDRGWKEKGVQKFHSDDDTVSSALGMVGQMVALISAYTDTPLHYPIATAGSRSVIQDAISAMSGPRTFPLFARGAEQYRFEYGHFLLNKNIEQLMNNAGITILDIRNTLPNLKNLIVTLTASRTPSSRLSRQNHVGEQTISLFGGSVANKVEHDRTSIGLGRPSADGKATSANVGYGSIVGQNGTASEISTSRASSRWGMSLLGWGNVKPNLEEAKHTGDARAELERDVPTVRTLGKGT
jgi:hypothetical protein